MPRTLTSARVLLAAAGVPGLAALVDLLVPRSLPIATAIVVRMTVFGMAALILVRVLRPSRSAPPRDAGHRNVIRCEPTVVFTAAVLLAALAALLAGLVRAATAITLLAVVVEEWVFRRELPRTLSALLSELLEGAGVRARSRIPAWIPPWSAGVILSQLAFATSHFVVRSHVATFGEGLLFLRLFAAGAFLAIIYDAAGLPVVIALHFVANELLRTGQLGRFLMPSGATVLWGAGLAIVGVTAAERVRALAGGGGSHDARSSRRRIGTRLEPQP